MTTEGGASELPAAINLASRDRASPSRSPRRCGTSTSLQTSASELSRTAPWPGCHIVHNRAPWILGVQSLRAAGLSKRKKEQLPDISVDPESRILSVINSSSTKRCFYLSLPAAYDCRTRRGSKLEAGRSRDSSGKEECLVTFVLVVESQRIMDVCVLRGLADVKAADVRSDIVDVLPPPLSLPPPEGFPQRHVYKFPLPGPGPYLCSQGSGGQLSHFAHPSTYHALDFDCEIGTPVLSIGQGIVQEVRDSETASGIDVRNFFCWNQVTVQHSDGVLVEYVHIAAGSASKEQGLEVGTAVQEGQQLCRTGDIGFCPRPHLHLEVHAEAGLRAASVPFGFLSTIDGGFCCEADRWYGPEGLVK